MPDREPSDGGTLIIAALLLLALTFAGYWIDTYVRSGNAAWALVPWFGAAAAAIVVVGIFLQLRRR